MMNTRKTEILVGLFIAAGLAALFMLAMKVSNLNIYNNEAGYEITANFENVSGLKVKSAVTMAGVRIGRVSDISFDAERFEAIVKIKIESQYNTLPKDTSASIYTAGLLGEKYIGLEAGGDEENLKDKDKLKLTQSSLVLEKLISRFVDSFIDKDKSDK
ncbi:MAG: outer membrane lipid asymmetry maintenance protein MlaD [Gammaproteobacteria bacterium]|nr:outer membrane lipid asymmetry maintenance protein MlaD [Gammaproteobacteria bacterium]MCW8986949.1 outer membrane lipid asymmetry maintenance protein MlaD [Gammaproteobacteria bacterium]MCW9030312.1 outer membrane lipid asymmetry maintenance protein MlaD [Gammaproteobacteria bacterium]